jgi:hypothetical protein
MESRDAPSPPLSSSSFELHLTLSLIDGMTAREARRQCSQRGLRCPDNSSKAYLQDALRAHLSVSILDENSQLSGNSGVFSIFSTLNDAVEVQNDVPISGTDTNVSADIESTKVRGLLIKQLSELFRMTYGERRSLRRRCINGTLTKEEALVSKKNIAFFSDVINIIKRDIAKIRRPS